jgi:oligoribonuclease
MSKLANMFSVLNLDAEDDREEGAEPPTSSKAEAAAVTSSTEIGKKSALLLFHPLHC